MTAVRRILPPDHRTLIQSGNIYYVGANDIAAFLITGPEGRVVLDAGYPSVQSYHAFIDTAEAELRSGVVH